MSFKIIFTIELYVKLNYIYIETRTSFLYLQSTNVNTSQPFFSTETRRIRGSVYNPSIYFSKSVT